MCSVFNPDCGYNNSTIILIEDDCCPNTKCLCEICLHIKTFQSLSRSDYQCTQCESVCQVRKIPFQHQTRSILLSFHQEVDIFEESPKSVQEVIGDVYCTDKYCSSREKCESLGVYVTTPRSIYGGGKCGASLFVHKVLSMLQEQVKTTKRDKIGFFFAKNQINLIPNK